MLDNDLASVFGGLTITSVTGGSEVEHYRSWVVANRFAIHLFWNFRGTEQFTYSIQDSAGSVDTATVTVNILPDSENDDLLDFTIEVLDPLNNREDLQCSSRRGSAGKGSVDDLRPELLVAQPGVASAFLDLLYTDELLSPRNVDNPGSPFAFDISLALLLVSSSLQTGDAQTRV